jgi:hypothetical protein
MVDATTGWVCDALIDDLRGAGAYAAIHVHEVLSVGGGAPVRERFRAAWEQDSPHLQSTAAWQGDGLLAELAYASLARHRACETSEVRCVVRLQEHWKPKVDDSARAPVTQAGTDPDWRPRPPLCDQYRGWKRQSVARDITRNRREQMAASVETYGR